MQERQHENNMNAKLVAEHAFHGDTGYARDGNEVDDESGEIERHASGAPSSVVSSSGKKLARRDGEQHQPSQRHCHLAGLGRIIKRGEKPAIARGLEDSEIIRLDAPAELLGEHVNVPMAPA